MCELARARWQLRAVDFPGDIGSVELGLLRVWHAEVTAITAGLAADAARRNRDEFHTRWNKLRKGGRRAHLFVRDHIAPRIDAPGICGSGTASAQHAVDAELAK